MKVANAKAAEQDVNKSTVRLGSGLITAGMLNLMKYVFMNFHKIEALTYVFNQNYATSLLPACRRLLFTLLHAGKGRLRNAVANRVPASRWQGILFRINCEII